MEHKRVYEVPESELLELKLDKGFLDYTSQREGVQVESYNLDADQWDER